MLKSALNQAGVTMGELKAKDIAVGLVHPSMLKTNFGGGIPDSKAKWFRPVDGGARGVIEAIDALTMETTGGSSTETTETDSSRAPGDDGFDDDIIGTRTAV